MDAAVWGFIGVIVGGVITGAVSIAAEFLRGRHESNLDIAKRQDDRQLARDAFQRENLLELQARFAEWAIADGRGNIADRESLGATGRIAPMPEDVRAAISAASWQLGFRIERVKDDGVREALERFLNRSHVIRTRRAVFPEAVDAAGLQAEDLESLRLFGEVQPLIGHKLREYL